MPSVSPVRHSSDHGPSTMEAQPYTHSRTHVAKKGWLYKRGGQLSSYKLKWAVLYDAPIVVLHLFDNRDSVNPKHVLYPDKLRIQVPTDEGLFGSLDALVGAVQGGRRGTRFRMIAHDRKYSLSAQSKKEREEWIATIQSCSSAQIMNVKGAAYDDDEANQTGEEEEEEEDVRGMLPKSASLHSMESIMTSNKGIMTAPEPLFFGRNQILSKQDLTRLMQGPAPTETPCSWSIDKIRAMKWHARYTSTYAKFILKDRQPSPGLQPSIDYFEHDLALADIIGSFNSAASLIAKLLVDGYHLLPSRSDESGIHGVALKGKTYLCGEVAIQFAADYETEADESSVMMAHKHAAHDLKGIKYFASAFEVASGQQHAQHPNLILTTPLQTVIDYKGFRLIAKCQVNDPSDTLYDLQQGVYSEDIAQTCQLPGQLLSLKPHKVMTPKGVMEAALSSTVRVNINRHAVMTIHGLQGLFPLDAVDSQESTESRRLRPEFVAKYGVPLSADAFLETETKDAAANTMEVTKASDVLRTSHLTAFVDQLDNLDIVPVDSRGFTEALHHVGINVRYLGLIACTTKLPYIREFCIIEMVARATKVVLGNELRRQTSHLRQVQANRVEQEIASYTNKMLRGHFGEPGEKQRMYKELIKPRCQDMFDFTLEWDDYRECERSLLYLALQYHCGVDWRSSQMEASQDAVARFSLKARHVEPYSTIYPSTDAGQPRSAQVEQTIYELGRHLFSLGPNRLAQNAITAIKFHDLAKASLAAGHLAEAKTFSLAAYNTAPANQSVITLICITLMEVFFLTTYRQDEETAIRTLEEQLAFTIGIVNTTVGAQHPLSIRIVDVVGDLYHLCGKAKKAVEYWEEAMLGAQKLGGPHHPVAANYLTKIGRALLTLDRKEEALHYFAQSNEIFITNAKANTSSRISGDSALTSRNCLETIALNHFEMATILMYKGDYETAVKHATEAEKLRDKLHGASSAEAIVCHELVAKALTAQWADYNGVITDKIRKSVTTAMVNWEKVFRFHKANVRKRSTSPHKANHLTQYHRHVPAMQQPVPSQTTTTATLMDLTKILLKLKFKLLQSEQKEVLRHLRSAVSEEEIPGDAMKEVVVRLIHLGPTVYTEELLQRLDDVDDVDAQVEMRAVLHITDQ